MVSRQGLRVNPNKAFGSGQCHWCVTEVNHRPLNLTASESEVGHLTHRLCCIVNNLLRGIITLYWKVYHYHIYYTIHIQSGLTHYKMKSDIMVYIWNVCGAYCWGIMFRLYDNITLLMSFSACCQHGCLQVCYCRYHRSKYCFGVLKCDYI